MRGCPPPAAGSVASILKGNDNVQNISIHNTFYRPRMGGVELHCTNGNVNIKSKDCERCRWKAECVNVDAFKDEDCLTYKYDRHWKIGRDANGRLNRNDKTRRGS